MKILYIEDNAVNLSLIQRIAQMNQHELISYEEAEVALDVLAKGEHVDLILLDIQLAGEMDGIDFAKALRARGDKRPIIAITAYAMMGDKERILEAGCNEYLPKPLPIAEFLTLLAKYDPSVYKLEGAESAPAAEAPAPAAQTTTPVAAPVAPPPVAASEPAPTPPSPVTPPTPQPEAVPQAAPIVTPAVAETKPEEVKVEIEKPTMPVEVKADTLPTSEPVIPTSVPENTKQEKAT